MSDMNMLSKALQGISSPPCEKFQCTYFDKCAKELLACQSFHFYVLKGKSVSPRMVWDHGFDEHGRIDAGAVPSRERYMKAMRNADFMGAA